jgi:hypothetical protein
MQKGLWQHFQLPDDELPDEDLPEFLTAKYLLNDRIQDL